MNKRSFLRITFAFGLTIILNISVHAAPHLDEIDTPTAATLMRGGYSVSIWGYDNGGILSKMVVGLHDNIFLGASFDIENVIGNDPVKFNIPGVSARIKFTDGWGNFPLLIAIGYDAFYSDNLSQYSIPIIASSRLIYGPYAVFTKPLFIFNSEQHVSFGVRLPVQPFVKPEDTSMFLSIDIPLGMFVPMFEIERVFFDPVRWNEILFNVGLRVNLYDTFGLELNFMLGINKTSERMLTFEYVNTF